MFHTRQNDALVHMYFKTYLGGAFIGAGALNRANTECLKKKKFTNKVKTSNHNSQRHWYQNLFHLPLTRLSRTGEHVGKLCRKSRSKITLSTNR